MKDKIKDWEKEFDKIILDICENDMSEDWLMDRSIKKLKTFIQLLLSQSKLSLLEEIETAVEVALKTFVWDRNLGDYVSHLKKKHDDITEIMENRKKLNKFVLQLLQQKILEIKKNEK